MLMKYFGDMVITLFDWCFIYRGGRLGYFNFLLLMVNEYRESVTKDSYKRFASIFGLHCSSHVERGFVFEKDNKVSSM